MDYLKTGADSLAANLDLAPEDRIFLDKRFSYAGRGHPVLECLYRLAAERLLLQPQREKPAGHATAQDAENMPFTTLDPISLVQMDIKLPSLPVVFLELQQITNNRNASVHDVADVIGRDPGLTAWILKLVNSPFFGFAVKIDTVSRAVSLVGLEQINTLAVGGMLSTLMVRIPADIMDMDSFWRHSVATGIAAQALWKLMGKSEGERIFVAGLLHDCGILGMAYAAPKTFKALNARVAARNLPRYMIEQEFLEFDHARLGSMLLHRWNMPLGLIMSILRHHDPEATQRSLEGSVMHVADLLAFALVNGVYGGALPPLHPAAWETLGLNTGDLRQAAAQTMEKLDEMCSIFRTPNNMYADMR